MRRAVFKGFLAVVIPSLIICSIVFSLLIGKYMENETEQQMMTYVELIDYGIDYDKPLQAQIDVLNKVVNDSKSRITVISTDGKVLADTSNLIDYDDNHSSRMEVQQAIKNGRGIDKRYSDTIAQNLMYAAEFSEKGSCIVRLAIPYDGISAFATAFVPAVAASFLIALVIAFLLARRLSKSITEPLAEISAELSKIQNNGQLIKFKRYGYDELNSIVRATETLSERIETQMKLLKEENNKMDNILYNMSEGLVLIDNNKNTVIINKKAREILKCISETGKDIAFYTQNLNIINGIAQVFENGAENYFDLEENGKIYFVHITSVTTGALILFIDVTYERNSQTIRQNFFSDASHELKTPITSINGYAELLTSGIKYSDEQQTEFLNRIKTEARNMTVLINDILMISRIEAGARYDAETMSSIKIKSVLDDILKTVEPIKGSISLDCKCRDISVKADYNHIYQLINNLVINAIKYNKPDGKVYVSADVRDNKFVLTVKDTGIGIPAEYQSRVFERFFRVDKGRSKKMGGTGLGLAIVKHIVNFYSGSIHLKSKVDFGTEIIVEIPVVQ